MTATGAEAGENLVPVGPVHPVVDSADVPAERSRRWLYRGVIAVVLAVLVGYGAWLLLHKGVRTDAFPPFLAGTGSTPITRYSGPWLTAAAGAALLAALLLMSAVFDILRWSRSGAGGAA